MVFKCLAPFANPTPITPPTNVWVVEIGNPIYEATTTVVAVASSAEKPRLGFSAVIFSPTVFITFFPSMLKPKTIPVAPKKRTQDWTGDEVSIMPFEFTVATVNSNGIIDTSSPVQSWVLFLGATGIVFGLSMLGKNVIKTVGEKITALKPSLGFSAELATATTVVVASYIGFPISTTHTLVGGVIGVGLAKGAKHLNTKSITRIISSWLITIPIGAFLTILYWVFLRLIFGVWFYLFIQLVMYATTALDASILPISFNLPLSFVFKENIDRIIWATTLQTPSLLKTLSRLMDSS